MHTWHTHSPLLSAWTAEMTFDWGFTRSFVSIKHESRPMGITLHQTLHCKNTSRVLVCWALLCIRWCLLTYKCHWKPAVGERQGREELINIYGIFTYGVMYIHTPPSDVSLSYAAWQLTHQDEQLLNCSCWFSPVPYLAPPTIPSPSPLSPLHPPTSCIVILLNTEECPAATGSIPQLRIVSCCTLVLISHARTHIHYFLSLENVFTRDPCAKDTTGSIQSFILRHGDYPH